MGDDVLAYRRFRRLVQRVEQLGQRHCGRLWMAGVLVGAGVGDHQRLAGRAYRVEQQLPVFRTDVALAGHWAAGKRVVSVDDVYPGKDPVIEADQTDHPVRNRPHRHHRADRERAGTEVGSGGSPGQMPGQQGAHVRQP